MMNSPEFSRARPLFAILGNAETQHLSIWIEPFVNDYDIHVITLQPNGLLSKNVKIHKLKPYTGTRLDYFLNLCFVNKILRRLNPDLLHVHYATFYGYLGACARVDCPKLLSIWGSDITRVPQQSSLGRMLVRYVLKRYDWINAPAEHIREKIMRLSCVNLNIDVFQYGVRTDLLLPRKERASRDCIRIVSLRNWDPLYRIDKIIDGFELYCENYNDADLFIFGKGTPDEEKLIRDKIDSSSYSQHIHFIGYIQRDRLMTFLRDSDIFISIPETDGTPLSLMEAMCLGLFPIVSDIDANREWILGSNGLRLKSVTANTIVSALRQAVLRVRSNFNISENRNLIKRRGDYLINMKRMRKIYEDFLNKGNIGSEICCKKNFYSK